MVALNEATGKPGMSPISVLLNLLWIIFGGLWMAAGWMIAALIMAITIIGLPWGGIQHWFVHAAALRPESRLPR